MIVEIDIGTTYNITSCVSSLDDICMHDKVISINASVQENTQSGGNLIVIGFGSQILDTLDNMPVLPIVKILDFRNNNLTNIDGLINCPMVECLYLQNNNIDTLPLFLLDMNNIKKIYLKNNPLTNIPEELNEWLSSRIQDQD